MAAKKEVVKDAEYYAKRIRTRLKKNLSYDGCLEELIEVTALSRETIDIYSSEIRNTGALITVITREGNEVYKKNPLCDTLTKEKDTYARYLKALGLTIDTNPGVMEDDPVTQLVKKVNSISKK